MQGPNFKDWPRKRRLLAVAILAVVVLLIFAFAGGHEKEIPPPTKAQVTKNPPACEMKQQGWQVFHKLTFHNINQFEDGGPAKILVKQKNRHWPIASIPMHKLSTGYAELDRMENMAKAMIGNHADAIEAYLAKPSPDSTMHGPYLHLREIAETMKLGDMATEAVELAKTGQHSLYDIAANAAHVLRIRYMENVVKRFDEFKPDGFLLYRHIPVHHSDDGKGLHQFTDCSGKIILELAYWPTTYIHPKQR